MKVDLWVQIEEVMTEGSLRTDDPVLIQGGMGVAISTWRLARAVARRGHMGVVSGTAIEQVIAARLQEGDRDGDMRRAFDAFPDRALADRVYERWYRPAGLPEPGVYRAVPMFSFNPPRHLLELVVVAAFAEVWLAKADKAGPIGMNLLEKIQTPTLPTLYGALLAGVDYVLMGAGIPRDIPGHLDKLSRHQSTALRVNVEDGPAELLAFDPSIIASDHMQLACPPFLAIVSSHVLAASLARSGGMAGFIIEGHVAGGHNAPPRGWAPEVNDEPVYGKRDVVDLERVRKLGLPFWLAGGHDHRGALSEAQATGAVGIQIGTAFALCSDSGMEDGLRRRVIAASLAGRVTVRTEGRGSPTGFPFKTLDLDGTEGSRPAAERKRQPCTLGYLRSAYRKPDGRVGWRCAAEPVEDYVAKGGDAADCVDRRCLCKGLSATAGHPSAMPEGGVEQPLLTSGHIRDLRRFLGSNDDYDANAVIDWLGIPDGRHARATPPR